jgi:anthranilate synthase component 1
LKAFKLKTISRRILADTFTPVSIYLNLRDKFSQSVLLESSDYHGHENSFSYLGFEPISDFKLVNEVIQVKYPDQTTESIPVKDRKAVIKHLTDFSKSFLAESSSLKFATNGLFGYLSYDAAEYFEDIDFSENNKFEYQIPVVHYTVFRYLVAIDHFKNELHLFEHKWENDKTPSGIDTILTLIRSKNTPVFPFRVDGEESSNFTDPDFIEVVKKGIEHCHLGDVIQIVLSRRFRNNFKGDEFNVYRVLRSINPSPYLFYFDYGSYKIFGSSPEAQIVIRKREASIYPIAGTFRRTGNDKEDEELALKLADDPKENSEHVMLVDLARNDLSRNSEEVKVETFKEVQFYSHVIHLVSKVTGQLNADVSPVQLVADTFPAGTLSGAPKHMAMKLINTFENVRRGYYGGAIGYMGFNGDFNHAIMIRSFLSLNNCLYYQAGAGVVAKSVAENELQEVNNKLAALRKALEVASNLTD